MSGGRLAGERHGGHHEELRPGGTQGGHTTTILIGYSLVNYSGVTDTWDVLQHEVSRSSRTF